VSVQLHAPAALPRRKCPGFHRRLGPLQDQYGRFGEQKSVFLLPGLELGFLGRPVRNLPTMPTELSRLPGLSEFVPLYTRADCCCVQFEINYYFPPVSSPPNSRSVAVPPPCYAMQLPLCRRRSLVCAVLIGCSPRPPYSAAPRQCNIALLASTIQVHWTVYLT
jgi:hypothetical protein